jgi:hypothetical protein
LIGLAVRTVGKPSKEVSMWRRFLSICLLAAGLAAGVADARPFRGSTKIYVLLCQSSDAGAAPRTVDYYRNLMLRTGTGGLADWWHDMSNANFNNAGSEVHGWYRMAKTTAQMQALTRWERVDACTTAASSATVDALTLPADAIRYIVTSPSIDTFGWTGGAFLAFDLDVGIVAHEGGHGIGLDHTFSNDPNYRNASWSQIGEYDDPWDAMSWANSYVASTPFGSAPAALVGPHLDRMGWLPRSRVLVHGANGAAEAVYTVAATNHPESPGVLLVRVPFDPADSFHYYTIEFIRKDRWAARIPADTVLIHEVKRNPNAQGVLAGPQVAWLQRDLTRTDKAPAQSLAANGVQVTVLSINPTTSQATVRVRSEVVTRCLQGYVWREARPGDLVCVTGAERTETRQENQAGPSRRAGSGPYGPDSCLAGFVWREAFAGDHVCVPPASRTRAQASNAQAAARANPARQAYGPNTCKPGLVWREADDFDWVCVSGAVRQQTRDENALAASRRQPGGGPYGPDTCRAGFVWREAYPDDHVCVPAASRTAARADNAAAPARLVVQ